MATHLSTLKATSSILSILRSHGVIEFYPFKIVSRQSNRVIVVFKNGQRDSEYPFSIAGLNAAIERVR